MRDEIDERLRRLAERQYGVFSFDQTEAQGADPYLRSQRLLARRWIAVGAAAYRMAGAPSTWRGLLLAAHWDAGRRSLVSHASAAQLHGWPGFADSPVEILVPKSLDHVCTIAHVRETRRFDLVRTTTVGLLPLVAPSDTLVHVAPTLRFRRLEWLVDELVGAKSVDLKRLHAAFNTLSPGCRGLRGLRALLEDRSPGDPIPNTELEKLFLKVVTARGLPRFERQINLPGREQAPPGRVDFLWPDVRIIVELDGRRWHTRVRDFERDSERRTHWLGLGYATAPVTWARLSTSPDDVCADLLSARRRALSGRVGAR
ncbi:MAG: hypothetical protein H0W70_02430 [Actinobacteria bacterium]|nr:hypothetical protein [Actinomycetota bacterium]